MEYSNNSTSGDLPKAMASDRVLEGDDGQNKTPNVKCAGCGKVLEHLVSAPKRANRLILSLCADCENITTAMFVCLNCGQECSSVAALRAHKQTHVAK